MEAQYAHHSYDTESFEYQTHKRSQQIIESKTPRYRDRRCASKKRQRRAVCYRRAAAAQTLPQRTGGQGPVKKRLLKKGCYPPKKRSGISHTHPELTQSWEVEHHTSYTQTTKDTSKASGQLKGSHKAISGIGRNDVSFQSSSDQAHCGRADPHHFFAGCDRISRTDLAGSAVSARSVV